MPTAKTYTGDSCRWLPPLFSPAVEAALCSQAPEDAPPRREQTRRHDRRLQRRASERQLIRRLYYASIAFFAVYSCAARCFLSYFAAAAYDTPPRSQATLPLPASSPSSDLFACDFLE
jgi:hypothetical protein